jgi:uncharacterized protein (DUF1778 family)
MALRIPAAEKALLVRAAALEGTDLAAFVRQHSVKAAWEVIRAAQRVQLSGRDRLLVLEAIENPPAPNARLLAAARALAQRK